MLVEWILLRLIYCLVGPIGQFIAGKRRYSCLFLVILSLAIPPFFVVPDKQTPFACCRGFF